MRRVWIEALMPRLLLALSILLVLLSPGHGLAQVSQSISYPGPLLDTDGALAEGQVAAQVKIDDTLGARLG